MELLEKHLLSALLCFCPPVLDTIYAKTAKESEASCSLCNGLVKIREMPFNV